jgi:hypothetical protein
VVLSGGVLALVLWREPDSNLARTLRDMNPWRTLPVTVAPPAPKPEQAEPAVPSAVPPPGVGAGSADVAVPQPAPTAEAPTAEARAEQLASAEPTQPMPSGSADSRGAGPAPAEAEAPGPVDPVSEVPDTVNRGRMEYLTNLAVRRAQQCHLGGRAQGTATAFLTFGPDGRVSDVRLEGEPVASAPVAACVIAKLKAVVIKPYDGPPFTHTTRVTLR